MSSTPQPRESTQTWNADAYAANGRFVADLAGEVMAWLAPRSGERILDLGCGDGVLSQSMVAMGADVIACDANPSMLEAASQRGLNTVQVDMRRLPFRGEFDAVFSNAALHWVIEQERVLPGVRAALRPGGRFVAEMGGHGNIAAIRGVLRAVLLPYGLDSETAAASFFPSAEHYSRLLQTHGFRVDRISLMPRPTLLKTGMAAWLHTFRRGVLQQLPHATQATAVDQTVELLQPILRDAEGRWWADYVRLRFHATRE